MRYGRETPRVIGGKVRDVFDCPKPVIEIGLGWAQKVELKIKVVTWANQIEEGACQVNVRGKFTKKKKEKKNVKRETGEEKADRWERADEVMCTAKRRGSGRSGRRVRKESFPVQTGDNKYVKGNDTD